MRWEVSMLPVNDYRPEELIQELIPEKYILDDGGTFIVSTISSNTESIIPQLIQFLFQSKELPLEVYRDADTYILDITPLKDKLINRNELEALYPTWLQVTGRKNSMNEYGTLIDFVGFGRTKNRRNLLIVVSRQPFNTNS